MANAVAGHDVVFRRGLEPGLSKQPSAGPLRRLIILISVLTVVSGLVQVCFPAFVLRLVGASTEPAPRHFFGIIGMFMALFGGLLLQALQAAEITPVFWCGLQKLGASAAVAIGVRHGLFSILALSIAAFDLLSGVLILWYWKKVRQSRGVSAS